MRPLWRVLSFLEQWLSDVVHQPALLFTLVVAPFLLLLAFGAGVKLTGPQPRTVIVLPEASASEVRALVSQIETYVDFRGYAESLPRARESLRRGEIDAIVVVPESIEGYLAAGEQAPLRVLLGEVDPVRRRYAQTFLRDQVSELNQALVAEAIGELQRELPDVSAITRDARGYIDLLEGARGDLVEARAQVAELRRTLDPLLATIDRTTGRVSGYAAFVPSLSNAIQQANELQASLADLRSSLERMEQRLARASGERGLPTDEELRELRGLLDAVDGVSQPLVEAPPEVLSAPFDLAIEDVTPVEPTFTAYYSPGVLVLLTQHLAITLAALTLSNMRLLRVTDLLRAAPIRAPEVLLGNYLAYGTLAATAAAALLALLILLLDVPILGAWTVVAGTIALLILVSLGVGFVISLLSSSVQQATQAAMLVLLGSIFFSGFAYSLEQLIWPARALSYLLPATYGIRLLQDEMLRGLTRTPLDLVVLGITALVLFGLASLLMRHALRAR